MSDWRHRHPNCCPVRIRGTDYPSQGAAARALGVTQITVSRALDNGTIDYVGLGRNYARRRPLIVDGVKFETLTEAAKSLGVAPAPLRKAVARHVAEGRDRFTWRGFDIVLPPRSVGAP